MSFETNITLQRTGDIYFAQAERGFLFFRFSQLGRKWESCAVEHVPTNAIPVVSTNGLSQSLRNALKRRFGRFIVAA